MNSKVIIIILIAVIVLGGGGYAAWSFFNSPTSEAAEEPTASELAENSFSTDEMTTDLEDGSIVRIQFQIVTDGEKATKEVEERQFQLKNMLIKELSTMNKEDFQTALSDLEDSLKDKLNEIMQDGTIKDVYTVSKVLQ